MIKRNDTYIQYEIYIQWNLDILYPDCSYFRLIRANFRAPKKIRIADMYAYIKLSTEIIPHIYFLSIAVFNLKSLASTLSFVCYGWQLGKIWILFKKWKNDIIRSLLLTNKSPRSENCPAGVDSWCECRQSTFKHPVDRWRSWEWTFNKVLR